MEQRPYHVFTYHAVGDAELARDGRRVEPMNLAHDERRLTLRRHGLDQASQVAQCLLRGHLPLGRTVFREFREELAAGNLVVTAVPPAPVDRDVGSRLEQERAQVTHRTRLVETQE